MSSTPNTYDTVRDDRAADHVPVARKRPLLRLNVRDGRIVDAGASEKKGNAPKGHEAFLKALELSRTRIELEKCDGTLYRGLIKHTDRYTLTVCVTDVAYSGGGAGFVPVEPRDRTIFKHAISEFSELSAR